MHKVLCDNSTWLACSTLIQQKGLMLHHLALVPHEPHTHSTWSRIAFFAEIRPPVDMDELKIRVILGIPSWANDQGPIGSVSDAALPRRCVISFLGREAYGDIVFLGRLVYGQAEIVRVLLS